jgi:transposase
VLTLPPLVRIYVAAGATDLRLGFDGLVGAAREVLLHEPLNGHLFVFGNARRTRVKVLYWDGTGFWIMAKRLERGTFAWPRAEPGTCCLTLRAEELTMLLGGLTVLSVRRAVLEREGWTPERLVEVACAIVGGEPPGVRSGHRSRGNVAARSVVAFVACDIAGWTMQETAAFVGVGPTALDNARRKGRLRLAELGVEPLEGNRPTDPIWRRRIAA